MFKILTRSLIIPVLLGSLSLVAWAAPTPAPLTPVENVTPVPIPAPPVKGQDLLTATAWVQSAAEAKVAARQAYRLATRQLDVALRDKNWTAATEQIAPFKELPPAIILDIDETVLDNSFYEARLVRDGALYSGETWANWVNQAAADPIQGAVLFLQEANRRGVQIFYVSNRGIAEEAATRRNLLRVGCPVQGPGDHILMNGERPQWTSDKITRRQFVAQNYRILLLVGDDLNDFVTAKPRTLQERTDLVNKYDSYWGERWILLCNPLYGSWEGAIYGYRNDLSQLDMLRLKYGALQYREPTLLPSPSASPSPSAPGLSKATR